jgi:hypothetical protein
MLSKHGTVGGSLLALIGVLLVGCGGGGRMVSIGQKTEASGWSARARDNFLNYCESTAGEQQSSVCDCEANKIEAQAPSDAELRELETNPADKERLVKLMIDASYACLG